MKIKLYVLVKRIALKIFNYNKYNYDEIFL